MTGHILLRELAVTVRSLFSALYDWTLLRTPLFRLIRRGQTFAFLVHPRTEDFVSTDVYGLNDIYRPFPALRHLPRLLGRDRGERAIRWFAMRITPITLSRIRVRLGDRSFKGYLLSTVRTPRMLYCGGGETRTHLADLFALASRKGVRRVGLGALLPSLTGYGQRLTIAELKSRPAVSTGHAYTGYSIAEYLRHIVSKRHPGAGSVRVAIVGAGGSTGKAVLRVLKRTWSESVALELMLVDVAQKQVQLKALAQEAQVSGRFARVRTTVELAALQEASYVIVVTNASGAIIKPEHLAPGTVIIDDSQPRNTSPELVQHGCHVIDVLARVPGLDCNFDFGFRTADRSVTFTCLAETILATLTGDTEDLAVGEVTDAVVERTVRIVQRGRDLGLIGELPFFSFARELTSSERDEILRPVHFPLAPAAE